MVSPRGDVSPVQNQKPNRNANQRNKKPQRLLTTTRLQRPDQKLKQDDL